VRLNRLRFFTAGLAAVCLLAVLASSAAAQATDTDTDGMPDAWETFFGLNPTSAADATGDPDGDGLTNLQEFQAGRHPVGRFARFFAEGSTGYFETSLAVLNLSTTDTSNHWSEEARHVKGACRTPWLLIDDRVSIGGSRVLIAVANDVTGLSQNGTEAVGCGEDPGRRLYSSHHDSPIESVVIGRLG
jgi:hypothetical protein